MNSSEDECVGYRVYSIYINPFWKTCFLISLFISVVMSILCFILNSLLLANLFRQVPEALPESLSIPELNAFFNLFIGLILIILCIITLKSEPEELPNFASCYIGIIFSSGILTLVSFLITIALNHNPATDEEILVGWSLKDMIYYVYSFLSGMLFFSAWCFIKLTKGKSVSQPCVF